MKIEIRNVKHAKFASQETDCFEATVLIDGKVEGKVSNEGHGGCNFYYPHDLGFKLEEYAKTLPPCQTDYGPLEMSADLIIGDLFSNWLLEKDLKKTLKSKILFLRDGKLLQIKKIEGDLAEAHVEKYKVALKTETILNVLPFDEALKIFVAKVG
jgi:hypothetical protein